MMARKPIDYAEQMQQRKRTLAATSSSPVPETALRPETPKAGTSAGDLPIERIGVAAYRPIRHKTYRQGVDLRPIDRERSERLDLFCLSHKLRLGYRWGLSLYFRAGLQLLDELLTKDEAKAEALLRSLGDGAPNR
jgi:hypothetical protein